MEIENLTPEQRKWFDAHRQRCEVWTRVMGYHRPVQMFNDGKQSEFAERVMFTESACVASGMLS